MRGIRNSIARSKSPPTLRTSQRETESGSRRTRNLPGWLMLPITEPHRDFLGQAATRPAEYPRQRGRTGNDQYASLRAVGIEPRRPRSHKATRGECNSPQTHRRAGRHCCGRLILGQPCGYIHYGRLATRRRWLPRAITASSSTPEVRILSHQRRQRGFGASASIVAVTGRSPLRLCVV